VSAWPPTQPSRIAGIDVGGTFTDLVFVDDSTGEVRLAKVPTTVDNQAFGVLAALDAAQVEPASLDAIVHGTTTTTNAMLERKIACVGLITTKGFRDVLELGRRTRPTPYGLKGRFVPLVERRLRLEVDERVDAEGRVLVPLDEAAVATAARALLGLGAESVVIHFLHSYINPAHEARAAAIVRALWPNPYVTAGHTIVAEYREYERGTTAAVNAAIQPVLHRYIARLQGELAGRGFARELLVMQGQRRHRVGIGRRRACRRHRHVGAGFRRDRRGGDGDAGRRPPRRVRQRRHLRHGRHLERRRPRPRRPAVGVERPRARIRDADPRADGRCPHHRRRRRLDRLVDAAGMLRVGPESAGATPGPICYGRGGTRPTITDANLALGRLDPDRLLAVEHAVSMDALKEALLEHVGRPLGLDAIAAAAAIVRVANDKMAGAIRMVSLSRGHDPRDFALFAFGGAGPLHAAALARELGIPKLLIPTRPGLTNALGCVVADLRHDFVATVNQPLVLLEEGRVAEVMAAQVAAGRERIGREGVAIERIVTLHRADMQFQGQSHICRWRSSRRPSPSPSCTPCSRPPTGAASASSCRRSGRCSSTCTPR
jgi:N-methylhydantoinase A